MEIFPTIIYDINEMIYKTTKDHNILQKNNLLWREEFWKIETRTSSEINNWPSIIQNFISGQILFNKL